MNFTFLAIYIALSAFAVLYFLQEKEVTKLQNRLTKLENLWDELVPPDEFRGEAVTHE